MKTIKKALIVLILAMTVIGTMTVTAHADISFNSTNTISLKLKKKKSGKLKGLTKAQKKKNWKFSSSDTSVAKVKRSGKYGYKITAAKKKDGYAVIRAAFPGGTETYLLVKVGTGKNINSKTRTWATNIRSSYKAGSAAYRAWTLPGMSTGTGSNGSNTGSGSSTSTSTNTGTNTNTTTDWYATHPQYTNVAAAYGARDNKMVPIASTTVVGTDKNGYGYDSNGNIGTDRDGKKLKAIIDPITFSLEVVPWVDNYLRSFDSGYYTGNGGPNYIGKNVIFTSYSYCPSTKGFIKIKTSAPIDSQALKSLHGVTVTEGFIDGNYKGKATSDATPLGNVDCTAVLGENPTSISNGLTPWKLKDGRYLGVVSAGEGYSGTYRYSVTIDGVTKYVDFKIVDHKVEWKNWVKYKDSCFTNAQVQSEMARVRAEGGICQDYPDNVLEGVVRISNLNKNLFTRNGGGWLRLYKSGNSILRSIPAFIAETTMSESDLVLPGCLMGMSYSCIASEVLQEKYNISPAYWSVTQYGSHYFPTLIYNNTNFDLKFRSSFD